jgi:hypothetical protein
MALPKTSEICSVRSGDIVKWTTPVNSKLWKVVQNWTESEPRMLLLVACDDENDKCHTALAEDCELVERKDTEQKSYARTKSQVRREQNYTVANDRDI